MRGRSTVNFRAKALFACSEKVASSVRDRCSGIPAAGRAVASARRARAAKWFLAPFYFQDLFLQAACATTSRDGSVRGCR